MTTRQYILMACEVEDRRQGGFVSKEAMQRFMEEIISEAQTTGKKPGLAAYGDYLWSISSRSYRSLWTQAWNAIVLDRANRKALKRYLQMTKKSEVA